MRKPQIAGNTSTIWEIAFRTSDEGEEPVVLAVLDANYSCNIAVLGTNINRAVTEKTVDNKYFRAWLTPTETAGLLGAVKVGIQITNNTLTPPVNVEHIVELEFQRSVVPQV